MPKLRIFFSTDIHGSERCFIKFINAAKFYKANVLIMGGDITGKVIVPIIQQGANSFLAYFLSEKYSMESLRKVEELEERIRMVGFYPYRTNPSEWEEISADQLKFDALFTRLEIESLRKWIKMAEERLKSEEVKVFICPGNDDRVEVDEVLDESDYIVNPDGKVVDVNGYPMIGIGNSNITPWNCPRDVPEDIIAGKIEKLASKISNISDAIFCIHIPPYGSGLDVAPRLDSNLKPVLGAGGKPVMISVGSISVTKAIQKYQPLLGLHGHIHESRGIVKIGRTICFNPGSEYSEGILRGVLLDIEKGKVKDYLLTSGWHLFL